MALYDELTPEEKTFSGLTEETYAAQVEAILTPWFRNLLQYDPRAALTEMTCPVFAVFGSKDVQVPVSQNEPEMRKALAKHPDATIRVFDGLNHLFQPAGTGAPSEYGTIETTLSLDVLEAVSDWILERSNE